MKNSIVFYLVLYMGFIVSGAVAQHDDNYNIIKTGNAYIIKVNNDHSTKLDVERIGLDCSTASLSQELNFSKIKNYFDEEMAVMFRNIKIQARVYIDFQGEINNLYFVSEENPENYTIDFPRIDKIIRRKLRVVSNEGCIPSEEKRYISWYIPLFEF
jgi:hypothetical protein